MLTKRKHQYLPLLDNVCPNILPKSGVSLLGPPLFARYWYKHGWFQPFISFVALSSEDFRPFKSNRQKLSHRFYLHGCGGAEGKMHYIQSSPNMGDFKGHSYVGSGVGF